MFLIQWMLLSQKNFRSLEHVVYKCKIASLKFNDKEVMDEGAITRYILDQIYHS